jgi:uncharacterized repeat protein (TIGR01451 family)
MNTNIAQRISLGLIAGLGLVVWLLLLPGMAAPRPAYAAEPVELSPAGVRPLGFEATLTVTSTADSGAGTLRQKIADALPGDTIVFSLTLPATITLTTGELWVDKPITITGPGPDLLAVSGNHASRVFHVVGDPRLSGLAIVNGQSDHGAGLRVAWNTGTGVTLDNVHFHNNQATGGGGGLNIGRNDHAHLTRLTFTGNSAQSGGGILVDEYATIALTDFILDDNHATTGGGICTSFANRLDLLHGVFRNNHSNPGSGGGLWTYAASGTVIDVTFRDNTAAGGGGGMWLEYYSDLTIDTVSFIGNRANGGGGAIYTYWFCAPPLTNVTMSDNWAPSGGALYLRYASNPSLDHVTIAGNQADAGNGAIYLAWAYYGSTITLKNTVIADNTPQNCTVGVTDQGYNLDSGATCGLNAATSLSSAAARLAPVGDYGGTTWTHALRHGSQAIDAIPGGESGCGSALPADQRGEPRPDGGGTACDIGAFERQPDEAWAEAEMAKTAAPAPALAGFPLTFTLVITNYGPQATGAVTVTDDLPPGVTLISAAGEDWGCDELGGVVTCTHEAIGAGDVATITLSVTAPLITGPITNTAVLSTAIDDPYLKDNRAEVTVEVLPVADLSVAKSGPAGPVTHGALVTYTLTISNAGPQAAEAITVTDWLPPQVTFVAARGTGWTCGEFNLVVTCQRATLAAGATSTITIGVMAPEVSGVVTNTVTVGAATHDPDPAKNRAEVGMEVRWFVYLPLVVRAGP